MGFLDNLRNGLNNVSSQLSDQVSRFKSADFAEATMSMCALIAAADGTISPEERRKVAGFIASNDSLKVFQPNDLKTRFDKYCDKLSQDYDFGRIEAIQAIGKLRSKPDQARAVIQLGMIIGGSDGNFDETEKVQVRDAARAVSLDPAEFGV
ncbi:tellurite resistance TerB family protein [Deinococcus sp. KNUC1210]|uniref:tellurite resistance TerB family protein n=1 Tax=Deinococcus sp. KNUC1210 TaxID=2917691 RepID=UPI001EF044ED|nr:tellurite resistance TerB family protein [Deinococcus sp. KNUC1210]ULH14368.1 tellurite resistance TerB family protein [Deinococcus sp. KNUC1210]